jgi:hypothetical protein
LPKEDLDDIEEEENEEDLPKEDLDDIWVLSSIRK